MLRTGKVAKRSFTVEEYHRMAEAGILHEDDHVELIEGEIFEMAAVGSRHAACLDRLTKLFTQRFNEDAIVRVQSPIYLPDNSEPEPDLALLRSRDDFYAGGHPAPEDVLLVVEVSETSVEYDSEVKLPLYARAGIPEVWLVNLPERKIEVHSRPVDGEYRQSTRYRSGDSLTSATVSAPGLPAAEILG